MLRRILAITLLIACGFPLVAPAFAATPDPQASLPACCRSHGTHRCVMLHNLAAGPTLHAPPCPFYPAPSIAARAATASLAATPIFTTQQHRALAPLSTSPHPAARTFLASANLKRGPPVA
jgi:hypothetical protein